MYALYFILNRTDRLDAILDRLFKLGVGGTLMETAGMGNMLLEQLGNDPALCNVKKMKGLHRPFNNTIMSIIRDDNKLSEVKQAIAEEVDFMNEPGAGFMFVLPVLECYGFGIDLHQDKSHK